MFTDIMSIFLSHVNEWGVLQICKSWQSRFLVKLAAPQVVKEIGMLLNLYTKKNRLEHQWLNELVNVHYNLRLKNRQCYKSFNYVPIDYESVDELESWIIEEEEQPTIVYEDLENMLFSIGAIPHFEKQCRRPREGSI